MWNCKLEHKHSFHSPITVRPYERRAPPLLPVNSQLFTADLQPLGVYTPGVYIVLHEVIFGSKASLLLVGFHGILRRCWNNKTKVFKSQIDNDICVSLPRHVCDGLWSKKCLKSRSVRSHWECPTPNSTPFWGSQGVLWHVSWICLFTMALYKSIDMLAFDNVLSGVYGQFSSTF